MNDKSKTLHVFFKHADAKIMFEFPLQEVGDRKSSRAADTRGDSDEKRRNPLPPKTQLVQDSCRTGGGEGSDSQLTRTIFPDVDFTHRRQITAKIKSVSACFGLSATCVICCRWIHRSF